MGKGIVQSVMRGTRYNPTPSNKLIYLSHQSEYTMSEAAMRTPAHTPRATRVPMKEKLDAIFNLLEQYNLSPKSFMVAFLEDDEETSAVRRRYYGTQRGWDSTVELLLAIKRLTCTQTEGRARWEEFILAQSIEIVSSQKPRSGAAPNGSYYTSSGLSESFFSSGERAARNDKLVERMPFLYNLILGKLDGEKHPLMAEEPKGTNTPPEGDMSDDEYSSDSSDEMVNMDGTVFKKSQDPTIRRAKRVETIAHTVCAMVAFGGNRRHNGFQLSNALIFLAAGVTERVSAYLNYIGIASARRTAHAALKTLGKEAAGNLMARFKLDRSSPISPFLCYDNLDFQEKVHMKSVERTSTMFHGTWGYIHSAPEDLITNLDPTELTITALNTSLHLGTKLAIRPEMFTPTKESTDHWESTLKSQITRVILRYLAKPVDSRIKLQKNPPPVHPIKPEDPKIQVLKLMVASDNSAAGVGDVFTGVIQQSGLTPQEFHSRLHIVEGDLGSCNILDSLRRQRVPATGYHNNLDNIVPIPGAAHTLWNISQAVFLAHWGNDKHARDTGAWRTLHALGVQAEKPVTKKDFNLMLCHIEKVHEANLLYLVLLVANRAHVPLGADLLQVSTDTISGWVEHTYERFCSREAFEGDLAKSSPAHNNLLLRLRDFATILEAQRAMKDGDYGRLMYMWERWAVMTQGLGKMPHYSRHLPKLIVQLKHVLPHAISQLVLNTLLISPTGKAGHFVATDQYLEVLNYWLKYFFNHSGIGTDIDRLKDVFSSNILVVSTLKLTTPGHSSCLLTKFLS
ncbi:hypothetical protein PGTUg99_025333 [Puccinia graminis f. sp. tritici]|uniref:DUF6589 domain-containing protein n=1 Tax=Puccinia graminis f. sp. tritici TaxID=56615 RepID=A0A5B0R7Q0_PUCGR|nr:hypothetical protein PGTUg99_025333 [Puccinia graminis f. sp. tritici]